MSAASGQTILYRITKQLKQLHVFLKLLRFSVNMFAFCNNCIVSNRHQEAVVLKWEDKESTTMPFPMKTGKTCQVQHRKIATWVLNLMNKLFGRPQMRQELASWHYSNWSGRDWTAVEACVIGKCAWFQNVELKLIFHESHLCGDINEWTRCNASEAVLPVQIVCLFH